MSPLVRSRIAGVADSCRRRRVRRLALFGSAASDSFDPSKSDLDLLAEFDAMSPTEHAEAYFSLQEDLQELFGVPVDLVESGPIRNPYFRRAIERTQVVLYEGA